MKRVFFCAALVVILPGLDAAAQLSPSRIAQLQEQARARGWTFTVGENAATRQPPEALHGLVVPADWRSRAPSVRFTAKEGLPSRFDWREATGCPPVRSQGGCGSCWAFGTVGALECAIRVKDGIDVDLSEQWLINCNDEESPPHVLEKRWGCDGGWWAHDYHLGTKTDGCGGSGAVLEKDCPYRAREAECACPYPHTYAIESWAYIGLEEEVADTDAIKQAILEYGPVAAAVYVNDAFYAYTGGVFNASEELEPNHAVVLVGWDDSQGAEGVWFLRNSWTALWGEDGYMRIEYGCSGVGFGANCVDYAGAGQGAGPVISRQPASAVVPAGWQWFLGIEASGVGALHYAWEKDGVPVGADAPTYMLPRVSPSDAGVYRCLVSDIRGASFSDPATIEVDESNPVPAVNAAGFFAVAATLPEADRVLRLKTVLFRLLGLPALVVRHARRLLLKLPRGHPHRAQFQALC